MLYTQFQDEQISKLAFGCMRLPKVADATSDGDIDEAHVQIMVDYALDAGVNYFDTAWGYHNGKSESVTAAALARHPRASYYLATKFPGYDRKNFGKHESIFAEQLERTGVESFDFYLAHNVCALNIDNYMDDARFGTISYLRKMHETGKIKHLGCSVHGDLPIMKRFLEAYGEYMEFVQIQLNYQDWIFQDAKEKMDYLASLDLPVFVMEPLRGGQLIQFTDEQRTHLEALHPDWSAVEWALRYVETIPGVTTTLSGMSSLEQLKDNIAIFSEEKEVTTADRDALHAIAEGIINSHALPCTKCRYCTEHCPQNLDIPLLIQIYNESRSRDDIGFIAPMHIGALSQEQRPSACIACRSCEAVCPQELPIADTLASLSEIEDSPMVKSIDS